MHGGRERGGRKGARRSHDVQSIGKREEEEVPKMDLNCHFFNHLPPPLPIPIFKSVMTKANICMGLGLGCEWADW